MPLLPLLVALAAFVLVISWCAAAVALNGGKHIPMTHAPEEYGIPYEPVEFRSADGVALKGWFVAAESPSARTIVFCHGWGANKGELLKTTHFLRGEGFNLLYFDFRCCGESGGAVMSVGALEARDLDAALEFLKTRRPGDRVAVHGVSMGSMVAFAGLTRHPELAAAVLECPFASHNEALTSYAWQKFRIPYYPFMPLVFYFVQRRLGFDPEDVTSPMRLLGRLKPRPILAVCGERDAIAAPEYGRELVRSLPGDAELWVVPGAGHARCAEAAGDEYRRKLSRFFAASFR